MKLRTTLGLALLASSTTLALAQPGGGGAGGGRQGGPPDPQQFIDRMMENDANGDGKLSRDEVPGRFAERLFENNDANGDGFIDREELRKVAESFGQFGPGGQRPGATPGQPGQPGAPAVGGPGGPGAEVLGFEGGMQMAGRALRQLRRSAFDDASRMGDLRQIQAVQAGLIAAKGRVGEVPMAPQAKEKYGEDQLKYESDMRLNLIQAMFESLALEDALIRGDSEEAKKSLENLLQVQKEGHAAFEPEEEEGEAGRPGQGEAPVPEPQRVRPGGQG
ncbi:MAG: hypothetical protein IT431_10415 [Phycisphaerales bacterium]|nr:hypothetical protein [Phycisphaerales bacterium]